MKKFHFSLQTVHNVRETHRDKEEQEFVRLQTSVIKATEQIKKVEDERNHISASYSRKLNDGKIDPIEAAMTSNYITVLVLREREAKANLKRAETALENQRQKLTKAERDVEATSRLRERQKERHALEMTRKEQNLLDDMATIATARQMTKER